MFRAGQAYGVWDSGFEFSRHLGFKVSGLGFRKADSAPYVLVA